MIRRQADLVLAEARLRDVTVVALTLHAELTAAGVSEDGIAVALRDKEAEQVRLRAEIDHYKRLRDVAVAKQWSLPALPGLFTALRLRLGLSQKAFAVCLGTHVTNLSRDERTGYAGIGFDRISLLLERLGLQATVVLSPVPGSPVAAAFVVSPEPALDPEPKGEGEEGTPTSEGEGEGEGTP